MPTGKCAKRKNQSICDKFALMAVNLVKDSSFVIAKMALGSPSSRTAGDAPIMASPLPPLDPTTPMLRVERGSHSKAYVAAEPNDGDSIDRQAAKYILKVKQQRMISQSDPGAVPDISNIAPPPPPTPQRSNRVRRIPVR